MNPFKKFAFLWSYTLLLMIVGTYYLFGPTWAFAGIAYTYVVIPVMDRLSGNDRSNISRNTYDEVVEAPQLPFGCALMILISYVPPLWFWLMNPRLERWQARAHRPGEIAAVVKQFA